MGTVTDLASVSLRSISAGVETKHHKLQHTPPYVLLTWNPFITESDASDVQFTLRMRFTCKLKKSIDIGD